MKSSATEKWIVCRICLRQSQEEMQTIFDKHSDKDLTQMILECGGVPIKQFDHYPDKICTKCLKYLRVAYKFRQTCQRSYKHLSRFIAPVVVEVDANNASADLTLELDDGEDIVLKLEPDEDMGIKQELSETEVDDVVDVYVPIDEDVDAIEEFQTFDRSGSGMSDEIEYLEDYKDIDEIEEEEEEEDFHVSDEDFIPNAKAAPKRVGRGRPPGRPRKSPSQKPSTSRSAAMGRDKKPPAKRGPKPKKLKETSFICDICGNIYPSQGRLTEHIKLHKGIKPHECEICGHCFAQTQQLARHMNTHTGNRPFKCNYCPAAFADLSTRNKHHRIHTNERPYVCDVCGKAFTYTNTLKFHKMIHTGEKPHVCDVCGKGFQQAYKLRNHKMTHEKKGVKLEKIEVETLDTYQEVSVATAQILEI